jgi:hypothetical protein
MTEFIAWFIVLILLFVIFVLSVTISLFHRRHEGQIVVMEDEEGKKIFTLELNGDPEDIVRMKSVTFKVVKNGIAR